MRQRKDKKSYNTTLIKVYTIPKRRRITNFPLYRSDITESSSTHSIQPGKYLLLLMQRSFLHSKDTLMQCACKGSSTLNETNKFSCSMAQILIWLFPYSSHFIATESLFFIFSEGMNKTASSAVRNSHRKQWKTQLNAFNCLINCKRENNIFFREMN